MTSVSSPHPYGIGRQELGWIVGGTYAHSARAAEVGIRLGDVVGRLDTMVLASLGGSGSPRGVALASVWRGWPVAISAHIFSSRGADLPNHGLELRGDWKAQWPLSAVYVSGAVLGGSIRRELIEGSLQEHQVHGTTRMNETVQLEADRSAGASHERGLARASLTLGELRFGASYQRDVASDPGTPFDRISVGGVATSLTPMSALTTRVFDPALDRDALTGNRYEGRRLEAGLGLVTGFWQQHRAGSDHLAMFGAEVVASGAPTPLLKIPGFDLTLGAARLLGSAHRNRAWVSLRWHP